jgi:hypothetical protein
MEETKGRHIMSEILYKMFREGMMTGFKRQLYVALWAYYTAGDRVPRDFNLEYKPADLKTLCREFTLN